MIPEKRKSKLSRSISLILAISMINQIVFPTVALALTGGPSQPEVQSFEPIGTTQMVDPFSGDFVYNIPLMDVDGYPLNISYHGGINMEQEASWVGLGWNLNPGSINRNMRGLPDDFTGKEDVITKQQHIEKNWTLGVNINNSFEFVGLPIGKKLFAKLGLNMGYGIFYNNYKGMGLDMNFSGSVGMSVRNGKKNFSAGPNISKGYSLNSQEGIGVDQSLSLSATLGKENTRQVAGNVSLSSHYNTRSGLRQRTLGYSVKLTRPRIDKKGNYSQDMGHGVGVSSTIPVGDQSYVPQISMPMTNFSFSGSFGLGAEAFWGSYLGQIGVNYSMQKVADETIRQPAYGYLYSNEARENKKALYDINREKDGEYSSHKPMLPVTNFTYDVYSVTGQGLGGIYRPYRNDQGMVGDPYVEEKGKGGNAGADITLGAYFKLGLKGGYNSSTTKSGIWDDDDSKSAQSKLKFTGKDENEPRYEPYYFKAAGELTPINKSYYNEIGGEEPVNIEVTKHGAAKANFQNANDIEPSQFEKRQIRNQAISVLNAEETAAYGFDKIIEPIKVNADGTLHHDPVINRVGTDRKKNHISEITTYRTDGARYVYGIPAYNTSQKEVSFNASEFPVDAPNGIVTYSGGANTLSNNRGFDHFYSSTSLPAYAHSYLLTAVLSADYVDRTGNGPSDDDFGTYTKFEYRRHADKYGWRTPYMANSANLDEGFKSDKFDDKGHYIYGEKEIWYLQRIVTKTMVAEFTLSDRKDGKGVENENGGTGSGTMLKLDKISLYSKCERKEKGATAIPLQEVHFVYDNSYPLCRNVPNNDGTMVEGSGVANRKGKLTLKEIYFTYQQSLKGKLSSYRFTYGDLENALSNPVYGLKSCDRWGNYKPNDPDFPNDDYPYSEQDTVKANKYAAAWSLTKIELPSGGKIEVNYEADSYAYVQDKRAMEMVSVIAMGSSSSLINSSTLYEGDVPNNFMRIKLPVPVTGKDDFINKYLRNDRNEKPIDNIFFRFLVNIHGNTPATQEYISGYAEIEKGCDTYGPMTDGTYKEMWIKLKDVTRGDQKRGKDQGGKANPIARTAWQTTRLYFSKELHPGSGKTNPNENSLKDKMAQLAQGFIGILQDIKSKREGIHQFMQDKRYGKNVALNGKSRIRLYNPSYNKIGGGSRVKSILVNDNWKSMTANANALDATFGQQYEYTKVLEGTKTPGNPGGTIISSGVAEYEPMVGNEENPLRQPLAYKVENWMIPDNSNYIETPVGESFYPGPSVGYSEIKVRSLQPGAGYIKHEFYTAKDFPVITEHTAVRRKHDKPNNLDRLLKMSTLEAVTVSQGHVIKLNNMHGQKKAMWVYAEGQEQPISGQEFFYRTKNGNSRELDNTITTIDKKGEIHLKTMVGKESDFVADMRENISENWSLNAEGEIDTSPIPVFGFPFPLPSVIPRYAYYSSKFKSATVTKVFTTYGILDKVVAYDLGSSVSSENLAYDAETGEVLLTKTENNFNDPVYTFNYPAHWAYDKMGAAYKNLGIKIIGVNLVNGTVETSKSNAKLFVEGDEVIVSGSNKRLWVGSIEKLDDDRRSVNLITNEGKRPADVSNKALTIVRSGRRNMASVPVGTISMMESPINEKFLAFNKIIDANAVEYSDNWPDYCECGINNGKMGEVGVPGGDIDGSSKVPGFIPNGNYYVQGAAGNWKAKRNYVFVAKRNATYENRNLNIREDGTYETFDPFWVPDNGRDWSANRSRWVWTTEVSKVSPFGFEIENRDSLNNFSSAIFGYSNTLAVAVAQNSRYREIGVDNFEDYICTYCGTEGKGQDHWSFKNHIDKIVSTTAHTGKNSMRVKKHSKVSVGKKIICKEKKTEPLG